MAFILNLGILGNLNFMHLYVGDSLYIIRTPKVQNFYKSSCRILSHPSAGILAPIT